MFASLKTLCWISMMVFYCLTLLGFVASTLAYVFNPALASNGVWTALVIVVFYWSGVFVFSRGTKGVSGLANLVLIVNNFPSYSGMEMNAVERPQIANA